MVEDKLRHLIEEALKKLSMDVGTSIIHLEHPADRERGDFSTNIAMVLGKSNEKKPIELAKIIVEQLQNQKSDLFLKIEIAGPGFINFFLSDEFFADNISQILGVNLSDTTIPFLRA